MDTRSGLISFGLMVLVFAFSFIFCLDAIALQNAPYGVYAVIGFLACIITALFNGLFATRDGSALSVWFYSFTIVASIIFVWYLTRCGTLFGIW